MAEMTARKTGTLGGKPIYLAYSATASYVLFDSKYSVYCKDRWGKMRARELPASATKVKAAIDAAVSKITDPRKGN